MRRQPDVEGRYRVNECDCHDTNWQQALAALVRASDVVLRDLCNFVARNESCPHELRVLAWHSRMAELGQPPQLRVSHKRSAERPLHTIT